MSPISVFKIFTLQDWAAFAGATAWRGAPIDVRDGYIHFSTAGQLAGTLQRHFAHETTVIVARFDAGAFGEALVWEPSREGALFPHLHGSLDAALVDAHWRLDAPFVLPRDVRP